MATNQGMLAAPGAGGGKERAARSQQSMKGTLARCLSVPSQHPTGYVADVGKKAFNFPATPVSAEQVLHKQDCRKESRMSGA